MAWHSVLRIHGLPMVPAPMEPTGAIDKSYKGKPQGLMRLHNRGPYLNLGVKKGFLEEVMEKFLLGLSIRKSWAFLGFQLGSGCEPGFQWLCNEASSQPVGLEGVAYVSKAFRIPTPQALWSLIIH